MHPTATKSNSEKYICDEIRTKDATRRPRFFVAPAMVGLCISRRFEIVQGPRNPLFEILPSGDEGLAALGIVSTSSDLRH